MATAKPIITPAVAVGSRTKNTYGVGEVLTLSCTLKPASATPVSLNGVRWKVKTGQGRLTGLDQAGNGTFTCGQVAGNVKLELEAGTNGRKTTSLIVVSFKVVAPTGGTLRKTTNLNNPPGNAGTGFEGDIDLKPTGVSFNNIQFREGTCKGTGTGYYAGQTPTHKVGVWANVHNGYRTDAFDTVSSGPLPGPYSKGLFAWPIPWQYRIVGTTKVYRFCVVNHVERMNATGRVEITKGGAKHAKNLND